MADLNRKKMFSDRESIGKALRMLHPDLVDSIATSEFEETITELLESGQAAEQIGRDSLMKIFASFICDPQRFDDYANVDSDAEDEWCSIMRKFADAGLSADELSYFSRQMQLEFLEDVCLALDNNVTYKHVPYSEFGVFMLNTHTNEAEVLIDGLHECVESIREADESE